MRRIICLQLLIWLGFFSLVAQTLNIYPIPKELIYSKHNDDFTVSVRLPGKEWQDLYEYRVLVDMDNPQPASMVQFDFSGRVELRIRPNNKMIHKVKIRPLSKGIEYTVRENMIYFSLDKPGKFSIEINENRVNNLHVFANEPETEVPNPDDPGVVYFAPGFHRPKDLPGNAFTISSNTTVYLAPGAVVNGKFICNNVENVRFIGRGYIDNPVRGFEFTHSKNIEINGITVINPDHYTVLGGEVDGLKINNLKAFSCKGWSDGIDLMSCKNVEIKDIFMRNSDDCIALYAHRWTYYGNVKNIKVSDAILWADVAHPINIGGHGKGNILEDITFSNINILQHDEDDRLYQGCLSINVADDNVVQNVNFENIWIDNIEEGQLFNFRVLYNPKYSVSPGGGIQNIKVKNIYYTGYGENPSIIEGYSKERLINNITFENIIINGKQAGILEDANIKVGKYVENLTFR